MRAILSEARPCQALAQLTRKMGGVVGIVLAAYPYLTGR